MVFCRDYPCMTSLWNMLRIERGTASDSLLGKTAYLGSLEWSALATTCRVPHTDLFLNGILDWTLSYMYGLRA
jgi:hypothetical protein